MAISTWARANLFAAYFFPRHVFASFQFASVTKTDCEKVRKYRLRVAASLYVGGRVRGAIGSSDDLVLRVATRYDHANDPPLNELLPHEKPPKRRTT